MDESIMIYSGLVALYSVEFCCVWFPVPLGSIPDVPADTCGEIKASEGGQAVSGNYWLDPPRSGNSILAYCDMRALSRWT